MTAAEYFKKWAVAKARDALGIRAEFTVQGAKAAIASNASSVQNTLEPASALFACISLLTSIMARLPHRIRRYDGQFYRVDIGNPLHNLLRRPNPDMTWYTFRELMYWDLFSHGNGGAVIRRGYANLPVRLDYCQIQGPAYNFAGTRKMSVIVPSIGGSRMEDISVDDLLHFKWYGYDPFVGMSPSPVETNVFQSVGLLKSAVAHQNTRLGKGFSSYNVIETDHEAIGPQQLVDMREKIEKLYSGWGNAGKLPFLLPGQRIRNAAQSSVDLQLIEIMRWAVADIARSYHIPLFALQADEKTAGWSGNTLPSRWGHFRRTALAAHDARISAEYTSKLMPSDMFNSGLEFYIDLDSLTMSGLTDISTSILQLVQGAAVLTPNEGREIMGRPPIPGGDELRSPTGAPSGQSSSESSQNDQSDSEQK